MKEELKRLMVVLLVMGLAANVADADDPNLVGWWRFDEDSGHTAADSSGSGHHGTRSGGSWAPTSGIIDGAVNLGTANSDHVKVPTTSMSASAGTVALWACIKGTQSGTRYFFGHTRGSTRASWPDKIQIYMSNSDNDLDLGLGDSHTKATNIATLSNDTWHHIALTWDGSNYIVYVDGLSKTSGTYTGFSSIGTYADIGNTGNRSNLIEAFQGFIDEVVIFDYALGKDEITQLYNLGVVSFIHPTLQELIEVARKSEALIEAQKPKEAIVFLENKIVDYEQWREKSPDDTILSYELLSTNPYFLLAKAKEAAGAPTQDVTASSVSALLWLFENIPTKDYIAVAEKSVHNSVAPHNIYNIAKDFESSGNWAALRLFLDAVFSKVDTAAVYARAITMGLKEDGVWAEKFWQYCRNKPELTEYVIEEYKKLAQKSLGQQRFLKAAEIYRDIVNQCGPDQDRAVYELKACECTFNSGQYEHAISELNSFIKTRKASHPVLVTRTIMLKGQAYVHLEDINRALDAFFTLMIEYPESKQAPKASYLIGYCKMLQGRFEEATEAFNIVVQEYPKSASASEASLYLTRIKNMTE